MDDTTYNNILADIHKWLQESGNYISISHNTNTRFNKSNINEIDRKIIEKCSHIHFYMRSEIINWCVVAMHMESYSINYFIVSSYLYPGTCIEIKNNVECTIPCISQKYYIENVYDTKELYTYIKTILDKYVDGIGPSQFQSTKDYQFDRLPIFASLQQALDEINPNKNNQEIIIEI